MTTAPPSWRCPADRRLGCGMHIRSKFHAALLAKDQRAAIPIKHFADLYRIEAECKERGLDAQGRQHERQARAFPILDALDAWVDGHPPEAAPQVGPEARDDLRHRPAAFLPSLLRGRQVRDRQRPCRAVGSVPSPSADAISSSPGPCAAASAFAVAYTLVDNCHLLGLDPYRYLVDVIRKIQAGLPITRLSDFTPDRWAADQAGHERGQ